MGYVVQVIAGLVAMLVLDVPVIKFIIEPTLSKYAKELVAARPDVIAAGLFYVGYVALVVFLSQRNADTVKQVMVQGAALGLLAYGTYELTSKAVIKGWPWQMVAVDMTWGVILTALVAGTAYWVGAR